MSKKIYLDTVIQELDLSTKSKALNYFSSKSLVEAEEKSQNIWAAKLSSDNKIIEADIALDDNNDEIIFYRCDCKSNSVCEHVAAALMVIKAKINTKNKSPNERYATASASSSASASTTSATKAPAFVSTQVETLYEIYKKMPLDEARFIKIATINTGEAITLNHFQTIFEAAFLSYPKKFMTAEAKNIISSLLVKNFITSTKSGFYQMKATLADYICFKDFRKDPDFTFVATKTEEVLPFNTWSWGGGTSAERAFRNMRSAYFVGDIQRFRTFWGKTLELNSTYDSKFLTEYFLGTKFNKERIEFAVPELRSEMLSSQLFSCLTKFAPFDEYYAYGIEQIRTQQNDKPFAESLIERVLEIAVLRADWTTIDKLAPKLDSYSLGWITGTKQTLAGDAVKAIDTFEITQKAYRKLTHTNKAILKNMDAVFMLIARFQTKNPILYGDISDHLEKLRKNSSLWSTVFGLLDDAHLTLINNKKVAIQHLRGVRTDYNINAFFLFIVMYWIDKSLIDTTRVTELYARAEKGGYLWVKAELSEILHRLLPQSQSWTQKAKEDLASYQLSAFSLQQDESVKTSFPLIIDAFPQIEDWENALNALFSIAASHKPTAKENDTRVIWLVDFEKKQLEAKEQTFGKSGWSVGRIVSASRFLKNEVKNMTEQDRKIIKNLYKLENTHWGGSTYSTNFDEGVAPLVGHPLLFLQKSPTVAVQLLEEKPSLVAKQTGEGNIEIQFSHVFDGEGYTVTKETPTRYKLLNISPEYARIADAMNGKKLSIPNIGRERVQQVIAQLSGMVDIQTSFDSDNDALPMIEADARICVHLLPIGDGFHVELYTKPFKTSPPYFKPGDGEPTIIGEAEGVRVRSKRDLNLEEKNEKF